MAANPASSGENPAEIDARRARVVWAKLGGYPLWPGVTYSSWEELANDGVQGVKQSARLRDTKTIVLFFESFQFQAVARECMQQFADVDHTQMLSEAKPRWKPRLVQAVQDAHEFIAGKSVPEIMRARKQKGKGKDSKVTNKTTAKPASKAATKSATSKEPASKAPTSKAGAKRKASSQGSQTAAAAPAPVLAAGSPVAPTALPPPTHMVKRSHYVPPKPARLLRSNSQPTEVEGGDGKAVDAQQQTGSADVATAEQSWMDVPHNDSDQQPNPVTELREAMQRNLSMYNSMMHAAQLQQQLIGNYLAQYQQQALLTRMAQEYLMQPSRMGQLLPMTYDTAGMAQHFEQLVDEDHQRYKHSQQQQQQQQQQNGYPAHGGAFLGSRMDDVFQGPAGATSVFSEHLESSGFDQSLVCFPGEKMDSEQDAAFAQDALATVSNDGPDADMEEGKFDVIVVGQPSKAVALPSSPTQGVSAGIAAAQQQPPPSQSQFGAEVAMAVMPAAVSPPSSPPSSRPSSARTKRAQEDQEPASKKKRSSKKKDDRGKRKKAAREAPAEEEEQKLEEEEEEEEEEQAPAAGPSSPARPSKSRSRAKKPRKGGEEEGAETKAASKAARKQSAKATTASEPAVKAAGNQARPHRHTLLAFWDVPIFSIIKAVLEEEGVTDEDAAARFDKALLASEATAQLASLDVRNDDWFNDESESDRADEDLLYWVGDALELVAEKRARRKQPTVVRTPADVAHSLRGSDRLSAHTLIDPATYSDSLPQPFTLKVHPQVSAVTDLHAHCCDAEVIGFLAGWHDAASNTLYVQFAVPCTSTERVDDGSTDVELDPEAAIMAKEQILERGLHLVGWYHTHPKFKAEPSVTDIANHHAQQSMFDHPFVGLIVSTFDAGAVKVRASHRWFNTMSVKNVVVPMALEPTIRALDPRHAELAVPSQYSDLVCNCVEKHLMEDSVDRWKSEKPTSPRGLIVQANAVAGVAATTSSQQSSVNPLRLDGDSLEQSDTEVGEPTSAASSHTVVSDGATEAQAVAGGSEQTVDAADTSAKGTKGQKQTKQPAKNARKKEPRSQKGDKSRSSSSKSRKAATETLALISASTNLARNDLAAYEMLLASMGASPDITRAFMPNPLFPTMYADSFRYTQIAASNVAAIAAATTSSTSPALAPLAPAPAPTSTQMPALAPTSAPALPVSAPMPVAAAPTAPTAPPAQAQPSTDAQASEQESPNVAPTLRGAGGPDSLPPSTGEDSSGSFSNNGQSRRASHRVPKRKQFDDEKVEAFHPPNRAKPPGRPSKSKRKRVETTASAEEAAAPVKSSDAPHPSSPHRSPTALVRSPSRSRSDPSARDFLWAYLRAEHNTGALARRLIVAARPFLQIVVQSAVVIGIYYAAHPRRVRLLERWRQACKLDKLLYSMGSWLVYLGMAEGELQALIFLVRDFLSSAWSGQQSSSASSSSSSS